LENRFRLPARILREIRTTCGPQFALLVKIDANGSGDLLQLLKYLQEAGVDGAEISGVDFNVRPKCRKPFYLEEAAAAQASTTLPLILVGGIFSRTDAEQVLAAGIPFVSFSRALICQPDFIVKMQTGELEESLCLACNGCYGIYRRRPVRCVQHSAPIPQLEKVFHGVQLE
jgi:2,4-dienoyl-CoA reductase-like NADH-dependent reductase (Old Yellow Enzyme family)